uniref:Glucan 1,3-beta-glucosidase 2 n=1 Tax=Lygus hesperus TaxID=30085 RepID=A0A0A9X0C6_LYGHE
MHTKPISTGSIMSKDSPAVTNHHYEDPNLMHLNETSQGEAASMIMTGMSGLQSRFHSSSPLPMSSHLSSTGESGGVLLDDVGRVGGVGVGANNKNASNDSITNTHATYYSISRSNATNIPGVDMGVSHKSNNSDTF